MAKDLEGDRARGPVLSVHRSYIHGTGRKHHDHVLQLIGLGTPFAATPQAASAAMKLSWQFAWPGEQP